MYLKYLIAVISIVLLSGACLVRSEVRVAEDDDEITFYVPDSSVAIRIAKAIWIENYKAQEKSITPVTARLLNNNEWAVEGKLLDGILGFKFFIIIRKTDAKVTKVGMWLGDELLKRDKRESVVTDSLTAIKIAEAVWEPIFGTSIYEDLPFKAKLNKQNVWMVRGTVPQGAEGGTAYIEIRKKDCRILKVLHYL